MGCRGNKGAGGGTQSQLTPRERLELFVPVYTPSNIRISRASSTATSSPPTCSLTVRWQIGFGVAKALHQSPTYRTVYTRFAQRIGTRLYMSPEQAEMSGLDIDTRTDVYSLGVLRSAPANRRSCSSANPDRRSQIGAGAGRGARACESVDWLIRTLGLGGSSSAVNDLTAIESFEVLLERGLDV